MQHFPLIPLSQDPVFEAFKVDGFVTYRTRKITLRWLLTGPTNALKTTTFGLADHELWRSTCFEFFLATGSTSYIEWNFSPDARYHVFQFDKYREPAATPHPKLFKTVRKTEYRPSSNLIAFEVVLQLPKVIEQAPKGAIASVLEYSNHSLSYWARIHMKSEADFHAPGSFYNLL